MPEERSFPEAARILAAEHGIELTPAQVGQLVFRLIRRFRRDNPGLTAGLSDAEVWTLAAEAIRGN